MGIAERAKWTARMFSGKESYPPRQQCPVDPSLDPTSLSSKSYARWGLEPILSGRSRHSCAVTVQS